jgi:thiol-disulfide isomerase/thioredoxin
VVAAGPDGTLGFAPKAPAGPTQIALTAPTRLTVEVVKKFGQRHESFGFDLVAHGSTLAYGAVTGSKTSFVVPQGAVDISMSDSESIVVTKQLLLADGKAASVRVDLQPTLWARSLGQPAPAITPTDVHNWPTGADFAAPRGKWVLVDFWATWCQPCVAEMPALIAFYEQHALQRGRFEIIAVHSPDAVSFAAILGSYERLTKTAWSGKPMPFPMVFDATGATHKRWGIEAYPTMLLIDPAGRIFGEGTLAALAKKTGL